MTSVSVLVVVLEPESDNEKLPVMSLPLCWLVSLASVLELVVTVSVWLVSRVVVVSLEVSVWLDALLPVTSLPDSLDVVESTATSVLLVVSVWLVSVSQVVVLLELESDSE